MVLHTALTVTSLLGLAAGLRDGPSPGHPIDAHNITLTGAKASATSPSSLLKLGVHDAEPSGWWRLYMTKEWGFFWICATALYCAAVALAAFGFQHIANEDAGVSDSALDGALLSRTPTTASSSRFGSKEPAKEGARKSEKHVIFPDEVGNFRSLRFSNRSMEARWLQIQSETSSLRRQSLILALVAIVLNVLHFIRLSWVLMTPCIVNNKLVPWPAFIARSAMLCGVAVISFVNWRRPSKWAYWAVMLWFFFYFPATALPPFQWSCKELTNKEYCGQVLPTEDSNTDSFIVGSVARFDCSLLGSTACQTIITWIFMLPWLMPRLEHMHLVWIWLVFVFLGWSTCYLLIIDDDSYDLIDAAIRFAALVVTLLASTVKKYYLEKAQRQKFEDDEEEAMASKRIFRILMYMMPDHVILPMLSDTPIAEDIGRVSILFIVIADFEQFATSKTPKELLKFLNEQFTQMDQICVRNKVTKIETVCEEYVAAAGVLPIEQVEAREHGHTLLVERMFIAAGEILQLQSNEVRFRMGIETGPIMAGVVGTKLPRYRLFGNTINTAARMMQKGVEGKLQFGEETRKELASPKILSRIETRGMVTMKGKGDIMAYTYGVAEEVTGGSKPGVGATLGDAPPAETKQPEEAGEEPPQESSEEAEKEEPAEEAAEAIEEPAQEGRKKKSRARRRRSLLDSIALEGGIHESVLTAASDGGRTSSSSSIRLLNEEEREIDERFKMAMKSCDEDDDASWRRFPEEMEKDWLLWHHSTSFCDGIVSLFSQMAIVSILLLAIAIGYMFFFEVWHAQNVFCTLIASLFGVHPETLRLPIFAYCSLAPVLLRMVWWYVGVSSNWIQTHPVEAQSLLVLSSFLVVALYWISFDALISDVKYSKNLEEKRAPKDQIFVVFLTLICLVEIGKHDYHFSHSLVFFGAICFACCATAARRTVLMNNDVTEVVPSVYGSQGKLILVFGVVMNCVVCRESERLSHVRYRTRLQVEKAKNRTELILEKLMPTLVVKQLAAQPRGQELPTHKYRLVTIAQSDLCGFTQLSSSRTPQEVVSFMSELFGAFDRLSDKHGVYKVETIGDAYIAAMGEPPLTQENSPVKVVLFALDMVRAVFAWSRDRGFNVRCRCGVHYGECIGGIVGDQMQRYHLFGDLLRVVDLMEATAPEARVQVSHACREEVERQLKDGVPGLAENVSFVTVEANELKTSKNEVHSLEEVGGKRTSLVCSDRNLRCDPEYPLDKEALATKAGDKDA